MKPRAIKQLTREGKLVKIHHSVYSAAKEMGGNTSSIRKAADGGMPTAYDHRWEYVGEEGKSE